MSTLKRVFAAALLLCFGLVNGIFVLKQADTQGQEGLWWYSVYFNDQPYYLLDGLTKQLPEGWEQVGEITQLMGREEPLREINGMANSHQLGSAIYANPDYPHELLVWDAEVGLHGTYFRYMDEEERDRRYEEDMKRLEESNANRYHKPEN